ncbi:helix-turn-helix domain-containing protein [Rubellimicrobium rubrum]|uniref:helix-turn-helix domain-containing protein n=1 Tax=Rubellimicrobium rubrum TaxID=2585369 RepID=UPI003CCC49D7
MALMPRMIHVRGVPRLTQLVRLVGEEAARQDMGRDLILERLVEVLLVEALRAAPSQGAAPGLLRGLSDPRIAAALRLMHGDIARAWTVADLARAAGLSRSSFFDHFARLVGVRPMEYLLAWRMAVAKELLRDGRMALDEVAGRIGYGSASTFSTAFSRYVGVPPGQFRRGEGVGPQADLATPPTPWSTTAGENGGPGARGVI